MMSRSVRYLAVKETLEKKTPETVHAGLFEPAGQLAIPAEPLEVAPVDVLWIGNSYFWSAHDPGFLQETCRRVSAA